MPQLASISGHEIDMLAYWLGVENDDEWFAEAWLVPLHELDIDSEHTAGYVLFAPEVKAGR